jgi:phage terminase large subunit-like protein
LLFTPKDTLYEREERDKVPYHRWVEEGHIIALSGSYINTNEMIKYINLDTGKVKEIAFDDWGAYDTKNDLSVNFDMIDFRQGLNQ